MRHCYYLFLIIFLLCGAVEDLTAQVPSDSTETAIPTIRAPERIIGQEQIGRMGATTLSEVLRFELNIEVERAIYTGEARTRTFDMLNRHLKILIDGIPIGSPDMFGGHVDINGIPLINVERIEISHAGQSLEYGSGTLAGVVNIITNKQIAVEKTHLAVAIQEESIGSEYDAPLGVGNQGRHLQQLDIRQRISGAFSAGVSMQRESFQGLYGDYEGKEFVSEQTSVRGYAWSPKTVWNGAAFVKFQGRAVEATYAYQLAHTDATQFDRQNRPLVVEGITTPLFVSTDTRFVYKRQVHHVNITGQFWKDARYSADVSYQQAASDRQTRIVSTGNNGLLDDSPFARLYATKTLYSRAKLTKPLGTDRLIWNLGYEMDRTNGFLSSDPGTYMSVAVDRHVFSYAGFTYIQWSPMGNLKLQPGIQLSGNNFSDPKAVYSLLLDYAVNNRNRLFAAVEKVYRYPNHRELFTFLETDFSLLEGNTNLKPEKGMSYALAWNNVLLSDGGNTASLQLSTHVKDLSDKVIIVAVPMKKPAQDAYMYDNVNHSRSVTARLDLSASTATLRGSLGISLNGTKGNDIADSEQFDTYLFHTRANAALTYSFIKNYWINANYRYVSRLPFYSFERKPDSFDVYAVPNRAPAYHLADVNAGTSFFNRTLHIAIGIRNVFATTSIDFEATDGLEHYRGDLRTQYIGYGRGFLLRMGYRF